ncbi:hypothetical protein [Leucobacter tenebrionis]|uniref:hypothetical protein n=1 Tax=Leucobacter tenebrionis TaxID=2873270 RepID=UPI001CA62BE5|nr:hypothetical protein [Leucobacter tenebrionis]QZY52930.1 hypothetical protein KVY00_05710 [Leucobacter tenebrionis]
MAGMIPIRRDNPVTDPTLAANVNKSFSASQQAVDSRVRAGAAPVVSDLLSNDPTIRDQIYDLAVDAIDVSTLTAANIALDEDGTPVYEPGNTTFRMGFDEDGAPFITTI